MSGPPVRLGTFLLAEAIGEGGMGTVFRARHPEGVEVAVKVLRPDYGGTLLEAFRAEVRSVAALDHPHIVRVYDYGVVPEATVASSGGAIPRGSPWLAMEYADNGTLGDRVTLHDFEDLAYLVTELLEGLGHAHARGLVHRDIKPRNVLLFSVAGHPRAALTDFGIAHLQGRNDPNAAQAGTPGYMAPEQIRGERRWLGPWTDLYALGCVMYRMASGRPPFAGPTKYHVLKAHLTQDPPRWNGVFPVPSGFEDFFRRMMARDPADRYASAADALADFRGLTGVTEPGSDWRPRHPDTTERPRGTGLGIFLLRPWPLVGRDREQQWLWDQLARAKAGRGVPALWLTGPRGLGRTRLVTWLSQRCDEVGAATAWWFPSDVPVKRRLRTLLRIEGADAADAVKAVGAALSRARRPDEGEAARIAAALAQDATPVAAADWLALVPRDRALLVVFDDLHDARDDVQALFRQMVAAAAPRVIAIATTPPQSELPAAVQALVAGAARLVVDPLAPAEQHRMMRFAGLNPRLAQSVLDRTGGNPWFVVRMVTEWARAGGIVPTTHGYDLRPGFEAALPDELVAHGLGRLSSAKGADAAQALELLALLGGNQVREEEWRAACARLSAPWAPARLVNTGVIRATLAGRTTRYTLLDPLLGDALLQAATRAGRRRALHLAVAHVLAQIPKAGAQERATAHFAAAGEVDLALQRLRAMVDEAFHHDRIDRVEAFLQQEAALLVAETTSEDDDRRILHELDLLRATLARGRGVSPGTVLLRGSRSGAPLIRARTSAVELQLLGMGAADPRWSSCREMLLAAGDARSWRRLVAWRIRWRSTHGEVDGALQDARSARGDARLAGDLLDEDRFEDLELAILILHRHAGARDALSMARSRALELKRADRAASWLAWSSAILRLRGSVSEAAAAAERAREELGRIGASEAVAMVQLGFAALARKAYGDAGSWFGRVLAERDLPDDLAQLARAGLGVAAADAEQWDLFDRVVEELVAALPDSDDPGAFPTLDPDLTSTLDLAAVTALHRGEVARARQLLRVALRHHLARRDPAAAERTRQRLGAISV